MSDEIKIPSASVLRLQMGEMTAQEVLTAQAAYRLGYLAAIRAQETLATRCEARFNDDGTLDEVVGFGTFHLEQMDSGHWWMQLGPHMVNLRAKGKVKANFGENEAAG